MLLFLIGGGIYKKEEERERVTNRIRYGKERGRSLQKSDVEAKKQDEKCQREALSMMAMNNEEMREAVDKISSDDERMTKLLALLFDQITREELRMVLIQLENYRKMYFGTGKP